MRPRGPPPMGPARRSGCTVRIDDLRIVTWDGESPPAAWALASEAEEDMPPRDRVFLRGGDRLSGDVLGVDQERVRMRTSRQELAILADEVEQVDLATAAAVEAGPRVRVTFPPHGRITVDVERVADGVLSGRSALVGRVRIPVEAILALDFLSPADTVGEAASEE